MDVRMALELHDGIATWSELEQAGVKPGSLGRAITAGVVARAHRGVYVLGPTSAPFAAAKRLRGNLSHLSAAAFHGLDVLTASQQHHITVPRGRRKERLAGARIHRRDLATSDVLDRWPVTTVLRTCMDCFRTLPLQEAVVVGDSALRMGMATLEQLVAEAARLRGMGSSAARAAANVLDERAESPLESVARVAMLRAGLPEPESQVVVETPLGARRLDFLFREEGVGVETDGFATHGTRSGLLSDCERHNGYALFPGLVVLRFGFEHVMSSPGLFTSTVRLALDLSGARWVPQCRSCGGHLLGAAA